MSRTLIIGDIHGADRALEQVLDRANVTTADRLIFLGDYVDGWSGSADVIERLIGLSRQQECIFIRGNHDTWCEEWLQTGSANATWLLHGGQLTTDCYQALDNTARQRHLAFFGKMKNYFVDDENNLFIHAGFTSMHGPEKEMYSSNYSWDRTLWEMALVMDKRVAKESRLYPKRLKLYNQIFIGHTPTLHYDVFEPMHAINVWNTDTGAGFHGRLSILDLETKAFWQSDTVRELYPTEKGRNNQ